ncbi:MAG: UbiA family prenyltransferase [Pseudomonadota bacterium]
MRDYGKKAASFRHKRAHQDKEDDALIGIKSTARLFGEETPRFLLIFLVLIVVLAMAAIVGALVETASVLALTIALGGPWAMGWHLSWQMRLLDIDDPDLCMRLFRSNRDAGLILALFLAVAVAF